MLYFVFTIDGDWEEYFNAGLPEERRKPDKKQLLTLIDREIKLVSRLLSGKFLHFVHTSPIVRSDFLQPEFISRWREIERKGGNIGVHCHEEDLYRAWYFDDCQKMKNAISFLGEGLRKKGLSVLTYRGGFMAFSPKTIPILEENGIFLDFSCAPGRYLFLENILVSDWRGAPDNYYRMDYSDHRRSGSSQVFEIPLGFYIETDSLWKIWRKVKTLKERKVNVIVSVLAHSYEFEFFMKRMKIKLALLILRIYGKFVNAGDVLAILREP
jgi:hypothetical protein